MARSLKIFAVAVLAIGQCFSVFAEGVTGSPERAEMSYKWRARTIQIALSSSLLRPAANIKTGSDLIGAVRRSLRTWEDAAGVEFQESFSDRQNVSPQGIAGDGISLITVAPTAENVVLFAKNPEGTAATTRVFYDAKGRITEADVVLNPYQQFSSDGTFGTFDLQSTITHEIGHLLGLSHSPMRGSTMHEDFAKNGVFGLQGFSLRTLAEADKAAIHTKYGFADSETDCCGTISAKISLPDGKPAAGVDVWAEDERSGKVYAQATAAVDGTLQMTGLPAGTYAVFSQRRSKAKYTLPAQEVGNVTVGAGDTASLTKRLAYSTDDVDAKYIGFNGQISASVVPVNAGKTYTIYVGGRNLSAKTSSIKFSSPDFSVVPNSMATHDFGDGVSVISFEMACEPGTPVGEYSVFVNSHGGGSSVIVGGIAVRTFINPYNNQVSDTN